MKCGWISFLRSTARRKREFRADQPRIARITRIEEVKLKKGDTVVAAVKGPKLWFLRQLSSRVIHPGPKRFSFYTDTRAWPGGGLVDDDLLPAAPDQLLRPG